MGGSSPLRPPPLATLLIFTEIVTDFLAKIGNSNVFSARKQVVSKKKRSSPKLRLIFRPKSEIQTFFQAESRHVLTNFGTQFPLGGLFSIFHQKSASNKSTKNVRFCILHKLMGRARAPPPAPLATLLLIMMSGVLIQPIQKSARQCRHEQIS